MGSCHVHNAAWVNNALRMSSPIWRIFHYASSIEDTLKIGIEMPLIVYAFHAISALRFISALRCLRKSFTIAASSLDEVNAFKLLLYRPFAAIFAAGFPQRFCP